MSLLDKLAALAVGEQLEVETFLISPEDVALFDVESSEFIARKFPAKRFDFESQPWYRRIVVTRRS